MAAVDYFLKLDGIKGESKVEKFEDQIQLESWSWGESQSGSFGTGGGGGAGKVVMQDMHCVMKFNTGSPALALYCATGKHIPKAVLSARKAGGKQETFLTFEFSDLLVSSYQTGGSAHGDIVPTDQVSLNFAKIQMKYFEQDKAGVVKNTANFGYDLKKNVEVK